MTHSRDDHPTRRLMKGKYEEFVVEIGQDKIAIRPKGTRRGGPTEVLIAVGVIYQRLLIAKGR